MASDKKKYFIIVFSIFLFLKVIYKYARVDDLYFLLAPVSIIVQLFTNQGYEIIGTKGFYFNNLSIIIDKSCAGVNFLLISFLAFSYLVLKHISKFKNQLFLLPLSLFVAYLFTIFVNSSRILISFIFQKKINLIIAQPPFLLHQAIGIINNLFFLVLLYYLIENLFLYRKKNEKFTKS